MNKIGSNALSLLLMLSITTISGLTLSSSTVSGTKSSTNAAVTVPEACTMTGTGMNSHTATINPNTYEQNIGKTTFTVVCNDSNGFSIYAVGYTGNSYTGDNDKLIGNNTNAAISTNTYTSGDSISSWSMKVTKITDSTISYNPANMSIQNSFDSWHAVPSTYTKVAEYHASTGSSTTDATLGAKVETTYASYIASNQPADVYEGQVKYTLVHPYNETIPQEVACTPGKICYISNSGTVEGTMTTSTGSDGGTVTLLPSNFSRTGYGFAGWSDVYDYATNPNAHFYGPMEEIIVPTGTAINGLSLYAVWIKSTGKLQDSDRVSTLCGSGVGSLTAAAYNDEGDSDESTWSITANLSSISALTDARDNQTYAIAKLTDGNCWMIENLRLDNQYTTGETNKSLAQGYGTSDTYGNFIGLAEPESPWSRTNTTANSLYSTDGSGNTINLGNLSYYRFPRYNNQNTASRASNTYTDGNIYSYGNYYTWAAAIADTKSHYNGTYNTTSICPKGWRIPTGHSVSSSTSGEFGTLSNSLGGYQIDGVAKLMTYSSTTPTSVMIARRFRHFPNNFILAGIISTSAKDRGGRWNYISSTSDDDSNAYSLSYYTNSDFYPGTFGQYSSVGFKSNGWSIRCIASPSA